jgi:hypothetical protein
MTHLTVTLPQAKLKTINADFVVDEIYLDPPQLPPAEAEFTYLVVQKENLTTFQLQHRLAAYFCQGQVAGVEASGLKDEQAITRQLISVRGVLSAADIAGANCHFLAQGQAVEIRQIIGYGARPVCRQLLHGNKFTITLRQLEADTAQRLIAYLQAVKFFPFLNYYDEQRFGTPESIHNTPCIGQAIVSGDWESAYREYRLSANEPEEMARAQAEFAATGSAKAAMQTIMPGKLSFFVSSYHSWGWNLALKAEVERLPKVVRVELPWVGEIALPGDYSAALPAILAAPVQQVNWATGQTGPEIKQRPAVITMPVYLLHHQPAELHPGHQAVTVTFACPPAVTPPCCSSRCWCGPVCNRLDCPPVNPIFRQIQVKRHRRGAINHRLNPGGPPGLDMPPKAAGAKGRSNQRRRREQQGVGAILPMAGRDDHRRGRPGQIDQGAHIRPGQQRQIGGQNQGRLAAVSHRPFCRLPQRPIQTASRPPPAPTPRCFSQTGAAPSPK